MESASVGPVDAVALVGVPEGQHPAIEHTVISHPCFKSVRDEAFYFLVYCSFGRMFYAKMSAS